MSGLYTSVGPLVALFLNQASLPTPASPTDESAGFLLAPGGGYLWPNGFCPADSALILRTSVNATLSDVQVLAFQDGRWRFLTIAGTGATLYPSLSTLAGFDYSVQLSKIGQPTRMLVTATISAGSVSAWLQRVIVG